MVVGIIPVIDRLPEEEREMVRAQARQRWNPNKDKLDPAIQEALKEMK